jgi:peptide/nickel transport system substrate-binding protein
MKSRFGFIAMLLVLVLALSACGQSTPEAETEPMAATDTPAGEEQALEPTEAEPAPEPTAEEQAPQPTEQEQAPAEEKVVLRVGILEDLPCWNPYSCFSSLETNWLLYDRIADAGPEPGCVPVPGLANSWERSEDGKTWTLHLDEGITFHDGTPFTAQTLIDHVKWIQTTSLNYWYPETLMMESIEAVDDLTVRYTTSDPIVISPDLNFIWYYVVPPDIWSQFDDETLWGYEYDPPIGTGPYMMTEHVPGQYVIWDAYPDYHRGKPPIDQMVWQIFGNEEALVNALLAGEIDSTYMNISPQYASTLSEAEDITVEEKPGALSFNLYFNMASEGTRHPAIADPAVREAIDYAVDKQQMVDVALLGHGITCPTNWACGPMFEKEVNPDLEMTPFDLAKANQILEDAGYLDTDSDGVRETPDGQPLEFRLFASQESSTEIAMADLLVGWLGQVGIALNVESLEAGTWGNTIGERDYDLAIGSMKPDVDPGVLDWYFSCWSADAGTSGNNYAGYCSEEMDAKVAEYWYNADPDAAWQAMFEAQRILNEDRPFVTLAAGSSIQAYRSDRFEFPSDTCHWAGIISSQGLMNAKVK